MVPTTDRIMATSLVARWRYLGTESTGARRTASIKQILLEQFAEVHSLALQQTLYEMGRAVLEAHDEVAEIKFSAPNKHHFVYDLSPFGLENPNEVFHADDRPYGLIQATVLRDDAPPAGRAWDTIPGFADRGDRLGTTIIIEGAHVLANDRARRGVRQPATWWSTAPGSSRSGPGRRRPTSRGGGSTARAAWSRPGSSTPTTTSTSG